MTAIFATQIELDERGIAWIAGTKVKVIEVVMDKIAYTSTELRSRARVPAMPSAVLA